MNNSIQATAFKAISAQGVGEREENETHKGLRVADRGFLNTAVMQSKITYINGDSGSELLVLSWRSSWSDLLRYQFFGIGPSRIASKAMSF